MRSPSSHSSSTISASPFSAAGESTCGAGVASGISKQWRAALAPHGRHPKADIWGVVSGLAIIGIPMLFLLLRSQGVPTAVDPAWPTMLVDWALLVLAMVFIVALWSESNRFAWFAQILTAIADLPGDPSAPDPKPQASVPGDRGWANPLQLDSLPQSPFSLCFRERDLAALLAYSDRTWRVQTRSLLTGAWPAGCESRPGFKVWQSRVVAELRYGAAAIRSAAWCAILAPTTILLGMGVYPPVYGRAMTTASVALIFAAFALVIYEVLKLDQQPLLGRMFTSSGDQLSIGGVIGALWGKLAAAALILIPVLFPDVLSQLYGLLQSIDSLR